MRSWIRSALLAAVVALVVAPAVRAQTPEIVVFNGTDRDVLVWLDGVPREVAVPGGEARFAGPEGAVTLMATDPSTGAVLATQHTGLAPGEAFTWTLYPVPVVGEERGVGTVVLSNHLAVTVDVSLGGNEVATLPPYSTRVLPRVVTGEVVARATAPSGETVAEETVSIAAGAITRWTIEGS